jgi:hypothetical protein
VELREGRKRVEKTGVADQDMYIVAGEDQEFSQMRSPGGEML